MRIIGVSGKPGSNKMFYAFRIIQQLRLRGYNAVLGSLISSLYEESTAIIDDFSLSVDKGEIVDKYDLGVNGFSLLSILESGDYGVKSDVYQAYDRRNAVVRQFMNCLGTVIRRSQNENYFIEKFANSVDSNVDFVIVIDLAFENEADYILENDGYLLRVNVNDVNNHSGGYKYNEGMKAEHVVALDDYPFFHSVFHALSFSGRDFGKVLEEHYSLNPITIPGYYDVGSALSMFSVE